MTLEGRARALAETLFPDDVHYSDCHNEIGREGESCRACASMNRSWQEKLGQVLPAILAALEATQSNPRQPLD